MEIIEYLAPLNNEQIDELSNLFKRVFDQPPSSDFGGRLNEKHKLTVIIAKQDGISIGFKVGYERYRGTFFSWLGGVIPEQRRKGIASMMMEKQHEICMSRRYNEIQTETFADNSSMMILNLKKGFSVYGTHLGSDKKLRVQLTRNLE